MIRAPGSHVGENRPAVVLPSLCSMTVVLDPEDAALHRRRLHRAAVALTGNDYDADDLVQDTYEAVLRRPRALSTRANTRAYPLTALERRHVDGKRRLAREGQPADVDALPSLPATNGERPHQRCEQAEVLALVRALPSPQRAVVLRPTSLGSATRRPRRCSASRGGRS
jgi:DNA-directed RNA polymerase specialized sigma24 family protein